MHPRRRGLPGIILLLLAWEVSWSAVVTKGTLSTQAGPSIFDTQLRDLLDAHIPVGNAHSTLLVLTECYGGDKMDDFAGRANTTTLSATSPGQTALYGGYHDDAAKALKAGVGRTSDTVHDAGVAGKKGHEMPLKQGPGASLEPTNAAGPIKSRHVLVYSGLTNNPLDVADRNSIQANFAGDANTTVTTVGGPGGGGWNHPGTFNGLRDALKAIGMNMNANEQFILFVTDHGDLNRVNVPVACSSGTCTSEPLVLGPTLFQQMLADPNNIPVVSLFSPGPTQPSAVTVTTSTMTAGGVTFNSSIDVNGDGDLLEVGEGWAAQVLLNEAGVNPSGETVTVTGAPGLNLGSIALESGAISKINSDVPTLSEWGMLVLAFTLLGAGLLIIRRLRLLRT
jgi:hypothetical protein